jgi:hypothetical protein
MKRKALAFSQKKKTWSIGYGYLALNYLYPREDMEQSILNSIKLLCALLVFYLEDYFGAKYLSIDSHKNLFIMAVFA